MAGETLLPDALESEPTGDRRDGFLLTKLSQIYGWGRKYSLWPLSFGLAFCVFEFFATAAARWDFGRHGHLWQYRRHPGRGGSVKGPQAGTGGKR